MCSIPAADSWFFHTTDMADTPIDENALSATIAAGDYLPFIEVAVDPDDNVMKNITFADFVSEVSGELALVYQPLDPTLTALAGLTIAANTLTIGTGADAFAQTAFAANTFPARASTGSLEAKAVTDYALTLLDDANAAAALVTLGAAPLDSPTFTGVPAGPTASGGTSTTQLATTAFVTTAISSAVSGLWEMKGSLDCSTNPNYPAADKGDAYYVSVAGKIGGASGESVDVGDTLIASADNAGGTEASVGTSWFVIEHNLNGALLAANNLSDLASAASARTNLGLGTMATEAAADYLALAGGSMTGALLHSQSSFQSVIGQGGIGYGANFTAGFGGAAKWSVGGNDSMILASNFPLRWGAGVDLNSGGGGATSIELIPDATSALAMRNGTAAQTFRVYGTYTDSSNYVRGALSSSTTTITLAAETAGTGADDVDVLINPSGIGAVKICSGAAQKLSFFGATAVVQQSDTTTALTTITATAPGTPDYALQDVTNVAPYGFADAEEARTFISVVSNLQARVAELEDILAAYGLTP